MRGGIEFIKNNNKTKLMLRVLSANVHTFRVSMGGFGYFVEGIQVHNQWCVNNIIQEMNLFRPSRIDQTIIKPN